MNYFRQTIKGIGWIGSLRGVIRLTTFIKLAILARLLTPTDFGLFGIAALVLAFLEILVETGMHVFLLQYKGKLDDFLDTAWVVSIARGTTIAFIIFLFSPFIANFFGDSRVTSLLFLTSLIPLVRGFINPANVRFQKELEFNKEFIYRGALAASEFLVVVYLAFTLRNPQSLLMAMIISAIIEVIISFVFIQPRPRFKFDWGKIKQVFHQGKWVTGYGLFNYFFTQGDDITVGKLLGEAPLGIYQNAYKLSTLPMSEVNDVFYKVTFPVYTKISKEPERLKHAVKKQILFTTIIMFSVGFVLFIFAKEIVLIVLGEKWTEAIPVVKVLAFLGTVRGISFSFNSLFLALEKQRYVTYITFISLLGLGLTLFPLVNRYGIVGAAFSEMTGSIIALPYALYLIRKTFRSL